MNLNTPKILLPVKTTGLYAMQCNSPSIFNTIDEFMIFLNNKYFTVVPAYLDFYLGNMKSDYYGTAKDMKHFKLLKNGVRIDDKFVIEIEYNKQLINNFYTINNVDMTEFEITTLTKLSPSDKILFNICKLNWNKNVFIIVKYTNNSQCTYKCTKIDSIWALPETFETEKTEVIKFNNYFDLIDYENTNESFGSIQLFLVNNFESFYKYINLYYLADVKCHDHNVTTYYDHFLEFSGECSQTDAIIFTYYPENLREYNQGSEYHYAIVKIQKIVEFIEVYNKNKSVNVLKDINTYLENPETHTLVIITWPHIISSDEKCIFEVKSLLIEK